MNNKEWKERIEELDAILKAEYLSEQQLWDDIKELKNVCMACVYSRKRKMWHVGLEDERGIAVPNTLRCYIEDERGKITLLDRREICEHLAEKLAKHVDPKRVIEEVLKDLHPDDLLEVKERVEEKEGKVTPRKGCLSLNIGGKPGKPFHLYICGGQDY